MAGAGYKLFNTGDVLTAAQVNTYLMEQTVMVFDDATARTTALTGVVSEGMISYLKDTNAVEVYDGSNWVASDDPNAIQNSIVDAKGDLISATADNTPARLAVGNNGETLVADSSASTGLRWQASYAAGKNKIINGDFRIAQRGTSFTVAEGVTTYTLDRWRSSRNGTGSTLVVTQETFTPGSAPVAGYEGSNYIKINQSVAGSGATFSSLSQPIEDVRTFAGQQITVSFWAKADTDRSYTFRIGQNFGSGGSSEVFTTVGTAAVTTSWTRFSGTITAPSISGKTIGTSNFLNFFIQLALNTTQTLEVWGVQLEAGSVATAFQTATGTLAGELGLCQRYYWRTTAGTAFGAVATAYSSGTTTAVVFAQHPVKMRTSPSSVDFANVQIAIPGASGAVTALTLSQYNEQISTLAATSSGLTANLPAQLRGDNNAAGYLGINAEL